MSKIKFTLNRDGVKNEILNADFVIQECVRYAEEEASQVFDSFHILSFAGTQRGHAIAYPDTEKYS